MTNSEHPLSEIKNAIKNDEFILYYQPKVSMTTGTIIGAEALIRWQKPNGKIIPPSEFIPLSESSGLITTITKMVFQKLIIDMAIFNNTIGELIISINASTKDFGDFNFVNQISDAIEKGLLDPKKLQIELTESSLLEERDAIDLEFTALNKLGVSLVMDDFGTGFSSIDILSKYSFSAIKLDRGIVGRIDQSHKNKIIVESSIRMGHQLGLDIIAEGIETEDNYLRLQNAGCSVGQGYWISNPLPLLDFITFVNEKNVWPCSSTGLLYMAQLDHIHWRKILIDGTIYHNNSTINTTRKSISDAKSCMLGKWYYGIGKKYAGSHWYDNLEEPHNQLHDLGHSFISAIERGCSKTELVNIMHELSKLSSIIIKMLQDIQNETLTVPEHII